MSDQLVIHWFRQDLRLTDNPSFAAAVKEGKVLPIFILDDVNAGQYAIGGAARVWLHHSLASLNESLNGRLRFFRGDAQTIISELCRQHRITGVYWNRCYEPWRIQQDNSIEAALALVNIPVSTCNGSLLWEPLETLKSDGTPYKVFTPFYRRGCLTNADPVRAPKPAPDKISLTDGVFNSLQQDQLELLPIVPWHQQLVSYWHIGEQGAQQTLETFAREGVTQYKEGRNFPAKKSVSRLSPYLHWGEISPHQVWHRIQFEGDNENVEHFKSELGWREFSYSLLYHFPELPKKNLQSKFDTFPWRNDEALLKSWQQGQTGYPIVDAGMRELWQTGYMHNRVRMIAGSFLVKNLLLHWHHGEQWFRDCLVDADLANNSASWQWIAGCGADAAPYFRIFNPITQGEKFDSSGEYTRRYVPELAKLPDRYLFKPWLAPEELLGNAGIMLGDNYPMPVVDIKHSRERALAAFKSLKQVINKHPP